MLYQKGKRFTLQTNLQGKNINIRVDQSRNIATPAWPIPKGAQMEIVDGSSKEMLIEFTWSSNGTNDPKFKEKAYVWVTDTFIVSLL